MWKGFFYPLLLKKKKKKKKKKNLSTSDSPFIVTTLLPEQYELRKQAHFADESLTTGVNGMTVPIFPCALAFPGMPISLNIFEPRYRLMIRRCLANGTHSFGMTMNTNPHTGEEVMYGTMLEMRCVRMLPDGRSTIETVGSYRFRIKERTWMDGDIVARIERCVETFHFGLLL